MRSLSRSKYRPAPVMNVTPLVDVVLVLLIIFMVVIPAMEKSAQVDLPSIFNVDPEAKSKTDPFTLSLTTDGSMYFEQEQLAPEKFLTTLRTAQEREPSRRLVLRADTKAHYGDVRKLFVACQEVGFPGVSLRVNELKGSGAAASK
jgi:biopolymer transport protein ExbD/biopolymer transport protein TolR